MSSAQPIVVATGCRRGRLAWAARTVGLPNSSRQAATSALIGFQSAISRSQAGIPVVGTKLLEIMLTGRYPFLERIVREAEDFPDVDATFERRLALVLEGLAASTGPRRPPARSPG
jgi:hypothetical protein